MCTDIVITSTHCLQRKCWQVYMFPSSWSIIIFHNARAQLDTHQSLLLSCYSLFHFLWHCWSCQRVCHPVQYTQAVSLRQTLLLNMVVRPLNTFHYQGTKPLFWIICCHHSWVIWQWKLYSFFMQSIMQGPCSQWVLQGYQYWNKGHVWISDTAKNSGLILLYSCDRCFTAAHCTAAPPWTALCSKHQSSTWRDIFQAAQTVSKS